MLVSALGEERAAQVAKDQASSALYRLLRTAELADHDVAPLVADVVSRRELDTADSIAEVLHYRVERRLAADAERQAEAFVSRSYSSRTPLTSTLPADVSAYVRNIARAMDERAAHLAVQAAAAAPAWAERLGPAPEDPLARMEWTERAAAVAAYREHFGFTSEQDAIGPRPGAGNPERRAAWDQAADALNIRGVEREMARHTEGELANLIDAYRREEAWLPPNVNDRLRTAHIAARESEGNAARLRAQLDAALARRCRADRHRGTAQPGGGARRADARPGRHPRGDRRGALRRGGERRRRLRRGPCRPRGAAASRDRPGDPPPDGGPEGTGARARHRRSSRTGDHAGASTRADEAHAAARATWPAATRT